MRRPLVVHVVGARPNYMKVAPVYGALAARGAVAQLLLHTGQHYDADLKDVFFRELPLPAPDRELQVGSGRQGEQTAAALAGIEKVLLETEPEMVVVAGDVNSTLAGALAAVKLGIPVCHVEAGLRSFDWTMPEEHNRRLTDHVSSLLLTHSDDANDNLAREGIEPDRVRLVGNTMIDSLLSALAGARELAYRRSLELEAGGYALVTLHRPALVDDDDLLVRTCEALRGLAAKVPVVFPAHPRTRKRILAAHADTDDVHLLPPLPYLSFLSLQADARFVVTDSGGIQEETTVLGVPCFTLRANTERPVTISHGTNTLLGLEPERIADIPELPVTRSPVLPPLWDGHAGERAAEEIERALGLCRAAGSGTPTMAS